MTDPHRPSAPVDYEQDLTRSPWAQEPERSPLVAGVFVICLLMLCAYLVAQVIAWWLA
ncbi:MAG: hypothetical protein KGL63_01715 [Betaproteobacteria bacterium]|nr:hypothetical protein [Betaproteobacteria bacterium]